MSKKIILIGNYQPEKQYSMLIFEALMADGYSKSKFDVGIIRPKENWFQQFGFKEMVSLCR